MSRATGQATTKACSEVRQPPPITPTDGGVAQGWGRRACLQVGARMHAGCLWGTPEPPLEIMMGACCLQAGPDHAASRDGASTCPRCAPFSGACCGNERAGVEGER